MFCQYANAKALFLHLLLEPQKIITGPDLSGLDLIISSNPINNLFFDSLIVFWESPSFASNGITSL